MADQFLAEIRMFAGNFAPFGWALCDGQIIPISQNTALFALLGTTYGGNGTSNFALPNLQGASPRHWGQAPGLSIVALGETGGTSAVELLSAEMPAHNHPARGVGGPGDTASPANAVWAQERRDAYAPPAGGTTAMAPAAIGSTGGNQPHNNLPPYLVVNFIIALQGIFPARS